MERWLSAERPALGRIVTEANIRLGFSALCLLAALQLKEFAFALPWVALITVLDVALTYVTEAIAPGGRLAITNVLTMLPLMAMASALSFLLNGFSTGLLILIPAYHGGSLLGRRAIALVCGSGALTLFLVSLFIKPHENVRGLPAVAWVLGSIVMCLLGSMTHQLSRDAEVQNNLAVEGIALLRQLELVADSVVTGFDAPAAAEMALERFSDRTRASRSAVLVGFGTDPAVPLAIRGVDRAPWPDPSRGDSVLSSVWNQQGASLVSWNEGGVERSLVAARLTDSSGQRIGAIVADRPAVTPFTRQDMLALGHIAAEFSPNIHMALIFAGLRERAGVEERERLAREMHNGIAQELAAFGFGLDATRSEAVRVAPELGDSFDELRAALTRILADFRSHIADLRVAVRPETGVGAAISTRLQTFGATSRVATRVELNETGFRLPAHTEMLIYRLFLWVINDVTRAGDATYVSVRLHIDAPNVEFRMDHDGTTNLDDADFVDHPLTALGAEIRVSPKPLRGVSVQMRMRARRRNDSAELTLERIPQPS